MKMMNIYEISNDTYFAKINLSRGANCVSLINKQYNAHILREPDYSKPLDNPYLYGMPILFPVNRIAGGKFTFEGREYIFPINEPNTGCHLHGVLHRMEFQVVEARTDYITCSYRATKAAPYLQFPHEFEVVISYCLKENGLEQKTELTNCSSHNMPNMLGFHTTFQIPFVDKQSLDDLRIYADVTDLIERNMETYLPTGRILQADDVTKKLRCGEFKPNEQKISRHYKSGDVGNMCIYDVNRKLVVQYENSANMRFRLLYNGNADEYICLEPQNCLINCLNENFGMEYSNFEYLTPGEKRTYISKISLQQFN